MSTTKMINSGVVSINGKFTPGFIDMWEWNDLSSKTDAEYTIVVTCWDKKHLKAAQKKAKEIFRDAFKNTPSPVPGDKLVSNIVCGIVNTYDSFFIAPDGSKEGWDTSDIGNNARAEFLDWLSKNDDNYCDYIEVCFGGDDSADDITHSNGIDHGDDEEEGDDE